MLAPHVRPVIPDAVRAGRAAPAIRAQPRAKVAMRVQRVYLGFHLLLAAGVSLAAELSGIVTEVQDGDTITLSNSTHTYRVRLVDIDSPELTQSRGIDARTSLREICLFRQASVETAGEDRYGRTLGRVTCAGVDAGAEQVRRGWAWVFQRYAPKKSPLHELEGAARLDRRGLWADDAPISPWEWRRRKGEP